MKSNILKNIFQKALSPFRSESKDAYKDLDEGKKIKVTPKSDRYTYENQEDTDYNKNWKPETKEEKESLSPATYFRVGEDAKVKEEMGINKDNEDFYNKKQISIPSTALSSIEYNPDDEGLYVQFTGSDKTYFYPAVPLELVQALLKAPSKGEFFMSNIHDQYSMYRKDHSRKDSKQEKGIKNYIKSYVKNNKGKWSK